MSQYSDELGAWWTGFPGSDRAAWLASAPGALAPARDGVRGAMSRRALRHGLVVPAGKRERARREKLAEWRRQTVAGHPRARAQIGRDNHWLGLRRDR